MPREARMPNDVAEKNKGQGKLPGELGIRCLQPAAFPLLLRAIHDPPKQLWIRGSFPDARTAPFVAVIGTRRPSEAGRLFARRLAGDLARAGCVIVSGLALGVDCIAHEAALSVDGKTVAILGSGIDQPTPTSNEVLADRIINSGQGCLLSEYPPGAPVYPGQFVERNRLIAGLSHMTIVVEGAEKSGARHTADFALSEGREVGAIPGNPLNPLACIPNRLLKDGAAVITCAQDVFDVLGCEAHVSLSLHKEDREKKKGWRPRPIEEEMLTILRTDGPQTIDTLSERMRRSFTELAAAATALEITDRIVQTPQGNLMCR